MKSLKVQLVVLALGAVGAATFFLIRGAMPRTSVLIPAQILRPGLTSLPTY